MFPLLPALILLLLNGPANIERLAADGRLPAALAAVQGRVELAKGSKADELALASLLALGGDPETTNALFKLLALQPEVDTEPRNTVPFSEPVSVVPDAPPLLGQPQDGLGTTRNSRDGPFAR